MERLSGLPLDGNSPRSEHQAAGDQLPRRADQRRSGCPHFLASTTPEAMLSTPPTAAAPRPHPADRSPATANNPRPARSRRRRPRSAPGQRLAEQAGRRAHRRRAAGWRPRSRPHLPADGRRRRTAGRRNSHRCSGCRGQRSAAATRRRAAGAGHRQQQQTGGQGAQHRSGQAAGRAADSSVVTRYVVPQAIGARAVIAVIFS